MGYPNILLGYWRCWLKGRVEVRGKPKYIAWILDMEVLVEREGGS